MSSLDLDAIAVEKFQDYLRILISSLTNINECLVTTYFYIVHIEWTLELLTVFSTNRSYHKSRCIEVLK